MSLPTTTADVYETIMDLHELSMKRRGIASISFRHVPEYVTITVAGAKVRWTVGEIHHRTLITSPELFRHCELILTFLQPRK